MSPIRKPLWAALTLAALTAGCAKDETTAPANDTVPAVTPAAGPAPETPPAPAPDATAKGDAKGGMSAEMLPPGKTAADAKDAPPDLKIEAPKVEPAKSDAPKGDADKKDAAKGDAGKSASVKLNADEVAEIKKLPAGEQDSALKQAVCPVSDEHLGSMGTPIKVTADGKTFYICCKGCKKEVDADPKAVAAKLSK